MAAVTPGRDGQENTISVERLLAYVRRVAGDEGVETVRAACGLGDRWVAVTRSGGWCHVDEVLAVAEAAADVCNDPDIGRRVGEEHLHEQRMTLVGTFLRQSQDLPAALALVCRLAGTITTVRSMDLVSVEPDRAEIEMAVTDEALVGPRYRFFCSMLAGYVAQLPSLFGAAGAVVEHTCQHLGADRCRFRVVWDDLPPEVVPSDPAGRAEAIERFEHLQAMALAMTRPEDVDLILERLVNGAAANLAAERAALVVHLPGERRRHVHEVGFDDPPDAVAAQVLDGSLGRVPGAVAVPIRSGEHHYGDLVAVRRPDAPHTGHERRLLAAYAGHAAAALEGATTLATARRSQSTAEALLDLAGSLASASDMDEIAGHLVRATTVVTDADQAVVLFTDDEGAVTARAAIPADAIFATLSVPRAAIPELSGADSLLPRRVDVSIANPVMAAIMEVAGTTHAVTVPISAHGEYLGTLIAGYSSVEPPEFDTEFVGRMRGLADQAAAAVQNVRLLEQIRHQALHDALTGLPNRPLMEDRARQAIVQAQRSGSSVGLLFLDLDRFKEVNDSLGHAVGDELLKSVADRLTGTVRSSDTVSRQGGDEFLVLLPNPPDLAAARHTAEKIRRELEVPFRLVGRELRISASIGVAWGGADVEYEELVHQADVAMYQAKAAGRNGVAEYRADGPEPRPEGGR